MLSAAQMGRMSRLLEEALEGMRLCALAIVTWTMGQKAESDVALTGLKSYATEAAYNIAGIHAYRGEIEDSFDWLDRAYRQPRHRACPT